MLAKDVDRLGYGDCKALSNYTRVLLDKVGVKSFYTVIYGDSNRKDVDKDFVSYQGNHAILTIPHNDKNYFLINMRLISFNFINASTGVRVLMSIFRISCV